MKTVVALACALTILAAATAGAEPMACQDELALCRTRAATNQVVALTARGLADVRQEERRHDSVSVAIASVLLFGGATAILLSTGHRGWAAGTGGILLFNLGWAAGNWRGSTP